MSIDQLTVPQQGSRARHGRTEDDTAAFPRILNLVPSRDTDADWQFEDALAARDLRAAAALPVSVDLREQWWDIGDQENTGSCVGWATADGVLRHALATAGIVDQDTRLSPRYIWMASKERDEFDQRPETFIEESGTSLKAAVDIARRYGVVDEADLPFHLTTKMYVGSGNAFFARAAQRRIRYYNLGRDLDAWKRWLAGTGPILAGFSVDAAWMNATATGGRVDAFDPGTVQGGHAVAIVGYLPDGWFIVRNSWGTGWGDQGFAYVSPAYVMQAFFSESYGVRA